MRKDSTFTGTHKCCSSCKELKPVSEFYKRRQTWTSACKLCASNREKQERKENPCECGNPKSRKAKTCKSCYASLQRGEGSHNWLGGRNNINGYVQLSGKWDVSPDKGLILEHRYVMQLHLGRKLLPNENVHHINGIRDDNRIENLELWTTSQPPGQRVQDKVSWAREILALYGKDFSD